MITMTDGVTMLIDDADIHLLAGHKPYLRSNGSGHRGVVRYEGPKGTRWRARIMVNGKSVHLGSFLTAAEAVAARRSAERENFGEECPR